MIKSAESDIRDTGLLMARAADADRLEAEVAVLRNALEAERARFAGLFEDLPFFAYMQASDYSIRFANKHFRNRYGEPGGRPCHEVIWGRGEPCERCPTFQVFNTGKPVSWESTHPDGRTYQVYDIPFKDSDGSALVLEVSIDKTHCSRVERERGNMLAQLMHAQKMATVGTFASGIAHDFSNIITGVKTLTDLALRKLEQESPLAKFLAPLSEASDRALSLVQQILLFSRNKPFNPRELDLNEVAGELLVMLKSLISEDITIETDFAHGLWPVCSDRSRLEQIILNLVINSSEAMPRGGRIVLGTANALREAGPCAPPPGSSPGGYVCLTVEDTGAGMDNDVQRRIFEPMFTTKCDRNAGMGLNVVQSIVSEHGGWIDMRSTPEEGTVFSVYLPATGEAAAQEADARKKEPSLDALRGKGRRILLVEDDKWVRRSVAILLEEFGYSVTEAQDAEQALSKFYRDKGAFDLVMSDMIMPGRNGLQLADPLREINPRVPVLFFSGYLDERVQIDEIVRRGYAFIQKPFEIPDLLCAVEETMALGDSKKSPCGKRS